MKTSWEKHKGRKTDYIDVQYNNVIVGNHCGTGMSDNAGSCTHKEFLAGKYQNLILENFGEVTLKEVIFVVKNSGKNIEHLEKRKEITILRAVIHKIPIEPNLKNILDNPNTINGFYVYGNQGSYKSFIESDTTCFTYQSTKGMIKNKIAGEEIRFKMDFHASDCVEHNDYYYLIGNDNLHVISPEGKLIFTTFKEDYNTAIFGSNIRLGRLFRCGNIIAFSYRWFYSNYPMGLIQYELGKGLTKRWESNDPYSMDFI